MNFPDVNILVAAFRADHVHHAIARPWLDAETESGRRFAISMHVMGSMIRVAINRRVFCNPSAGADAVEFCEALRRHPSATRIAPGERHWELFCGFVVDVAATGDHTPDAWLAALAIEHGCTLVTLDRGFSRYAGLRFRSP
jgi:hypothetical protein